MAEAKMLPGAGFRAVLTYPDGVVLVMWMPGTGGEMLDVLHRVRQQVAHGEIPERLSLESVS